MPARQRPKFPVFMDPAERYPVGSIDWAGRMSCRAFHEYNRAEICGFRPLVEVLDAAIPGQPWLSWPPESPWGSIEVWAKELFGLPWAKVLDVVEPVDPDAAQRLRMLAAPSTTKKRGRPCRGNVDDVNIRDTGGGNSSTYLAARLKRDRLDLAAEVEAGRKKLRTAAREAGIVKDPTGFDRLRAAWRRASMADRNAFLAWLDTQLKGDAA